MVLMVYCLRGGIEAFGRMGEVVFPSYIFSLIVIWILLLSSGEFNVNNLTPVFGNGLRPVLKELFPNVLTFPFGELIIITMLSPFLNKEQHIKRVAIFVVLFTGVAMAKYDHDYICIRNRNLQTGLFSTSYCNTNGCYCRLS
jgi:spore germination protein KB